MKSWTVLIIYFIVGIASADNLIDIYNLAKNNDQELQAAYQQHKASLEVMPQAVGTLLPNLSASTGAGRVSVPKSNTWNYSLNITQPIVNFKYWQLVSNAKTEVKKAAALLADVEQIFLLKVVEKYFKLLQAEDDLRFIEAEKDIVSKHLEQAKQRYKIGQAALVDLHKAQARYESRGAEHVAAESALADAREKLWEITKQRVSSLAKFKKDIVLTPPKPKDVEKWVQTAIDNNCKLQAGRYDLDISKRTIKLAQADHFPTVGVVASANRGKNIIGDNKLRRSDSIGISMNIPIFKGGIDYSKMRQATYLYEAATKELEAQHRKIESETRTAYGQVFTQLSRIKAFSHTVISNTSALKAYKQEFKVGIRTVVEVLDAESDLIKAQKDHMRAKYTYILQSLKLKYLAGNLNACDLKEVNLWLQ